MRRRTFSQTLAALALLSSSRVRASTAKKIVVVGAGIVGSSVAYHLARRGAKVVLIDKDSPAAHASGRTFAWINASYAKRPFSYHLLSRLSVMRYRTLADELNLPVRWGGALEWFSTPEQQAILGARIKEQQAFGSPERIIDGAMAASLEPELRLGGTSQVAYSELDGAIDAPTAVKVLVEAAQVAGAQVEFPSQVKGFQHQPSDQVLVHTTRGQHLADHVVLAAGTGTEPLTALAGYAIPQKPTPGVIVKTQPVRRILNRVVVAPGIHLHQQTDGRIVMGEQGGPPQTKAHEDRLQSRPEAFPTEEFAMQHALRIRTAGKQFFPELAKARIESTVIGWRPMPSDGQPVIGPLKANPSIYVAVMHSGVTLAPIVGQLAAMELLDDIQTDLLRDFRPDRFT